MAGPECLMTIHSWDHSVQMVECRWTHTEAEPSPAPPDMREHGALVVVIVLLPVSAWRGRSVHSFVFSRSKMYRKILFKKNEITTLKNH